MVLQLHLLISMSSRNGALKRLVGVVIGVVILGLSPSGQAYETDQYSVPTSDIQDVGEGLSLFIYRALMTTLNEQKERRFADQSEFINSFRSKISGAITWEEQRDGVFGKSFGLFETSEKVPVLYNPGKTRSVYTLSGFHRIISPTFFVFSATMKAYGFYFGVDKLGHIFNQGFQYWEAYQSARAAGVSPARAAQAIVSWGIGTESGFFGEIVDGVYSNADLAANFAGFQFYQNIFKDLSKGDKVHPALLKMDPSSGLYIWNDQVEPRALLVPFISNHLNEALNPSVLERLQRPLVQRAIFHRCRAWLKFYNNPRQADLRSETDQLKTWYGHYYGQVAKNTLRLDQICF